MKRILIVDDEPDIVELLADVLESEGYTVERAANGAIALELVRQKTPDLLLTDVMMPRLSGPELIHAIREELALTRLPILVMSAAERPAADHLGVGAFLAKPFDLDTLLDTVDKALER